MNSVIEICNAALDACRAPVIVSLDDASEAARVCARAFPRARDATMAAYPWNPTMRREILPRVQAPPAWGFEAAYQVPRDFLALWRIDGEPPYKIEGTRIVTDAAGPLRIVYSARVENVAEWSPLLKEAVAAHLAYLIAPRLIESTSARQDMWQSYRAILQEARNTDAQQGTADAMDTDVWLKERWA